MMMESAHTLVHSYASALYAAAVKASAQKAVYQELQQLQKAVAQQPALATLLHSPLTQASQALLRCTTALKPHLHSCTHALLRLLLARKRQYLLLPIIQSFAQQYEAAQGFQEVYLTTAAPITHTTMAGFQKLAAAMLPSQHIPKIIHHTDPHLIGGYTLQLGDRKLDASLRRRLEAMAKRWCQPPLCTTLYHHEKQHPPR